MQKKNKYQAKIEKKLEYFKDKISVDMLDSRALHILNIAFKRAQKGLILVYDPIQYNFEGRKQKIPYKQVDIFKKRWC